MTWSNGPALFALLLLACVVGGCSLGDESPGTFTVAFSWNDPPPQEKTWVYGRVERFDGSNRVRVAEAPLEAMSDAAVLQFASVPHGGPYRVVVELKVAPSRRARTLYFGESETFELQPGKHVDVAVALSLTAAPSGDDENPSGALQIMGQNQAGYVREQLATLGLAPRGATQAIVANDFVLSKGRREVDLAVLPTEDSRYLLQWDLDQGLCPRAPCPDGKRFVYVQFLNDLGYASEVVSASVELDRAAPDLAAIALSPERARADVEVALTVTPSEPLAEPPHLIVSPQDPGFGAFTQLAGGAYVARFLTEGTLAAREEYRFAVQLIDRAGNRSEHVIDHVLSIDSTAPGLVWGADVAPSVVGDGEVYSLSFELDEVVAELPLVRVGGAVVTCMFEGPSMRRVRCSHVATQSEGTGERPISIEARDLADNAATLLAGSVLYDTLPRCGDAVVRTNGFEVCDEGDANSNAPDAECRPDCRPRRCGDGIEDPLHGEVCDDGNVEDKDGCAADCRSTEACGNGLIDVRAGEVCDDKNLLSHDGCSSACQLENLVGDAFHPPLLDEGAMAYDSMRGRVVAFDEDARAMLVLDELGFRRASPVFLERQAPEDAQLVYDVARDRVVLIADELWEWDGASSIERRTGLDAIRPVLLPGAAVTYVGSKGHALVFGGGPFVAGSGNRRVSGTANLWAWDGHYWDELTPDATDSPPPRAYAAVAYDPRRDRVVLFGGIGDKGRLGDTWEWDGYSWWRMEPIGTLPPPGRDHVMAYDAARSRVVLVVDGRDETSGWEWDGKRWASVGIDVVADSEPTALVFDAHRRRMFATGDYYALARPTGSTEWEVVFDGVDDPETALGHAVAYEGARARAVVFGGYVPADTAFGESTEERYSADTWVSSGLSWTLLEVGSDGPSERAFAAMAHDPVRDVSILFGGQVGVDQPCEGGCDDITLLGDTWELEGNVWREVAAEGNGPAPVAAAKMFYDLARGRVTLFAPGEEGEMAVWQWDGVRWEQLALGGDVPAWREGFDVAYDAVRRRAVMFGGTALTATGTEVKLGDTWEWDGTQFYARAPLVSPTPRRDHALTFHATRGSVLLHGGAEVGGSSAEVWEWLGDTWLQLGEDLIALEAHRLFFDPKSHAAISVGGFTRADDERSVEGFSHGWRFDTEQASCATWLEGCGLSIPRDELCHGDRDGDGDGLIGCADPDCYGRCSPLCNPTAVECDPDLPRCGDAVCSEAEDCSLCATDCGPCAALCGDFSCGQNEDAVSCPGDCAR